MVEPVASVEPPDGCEPELEPEPGVGDAVVDDVGPTSTTFVVVFRWNVATMAMPATSEIATRTTSAMMNFRRDFRSLLLRALLRSRR